MKDGEMNGWDWFWFFAFILALQAIFGCTQTYTLESTRGVPGSVDYCVDQAHIIVSPGSADAWGRAVANYGEWCSSSGGGGGDGDDNGLPKVQPGRINFGPAFGRDFQTRPCLQCHSAGFVEYKL